MSFLGAVTGGVFMKGTGGTRPGSIVPSTVADAFARRREASLALVECAEVVSRAGAAMTAKFSGGNPAGSANAHHVL
jgi:hypothetical protein